MSLSKKPLHQHSSLARKVLIVGSTALALCMMQTAAQAADLASKDKEFILKAADAGNTEIMASQSAQTKSSSDSVKAFASTMIKEHSDVNQNLQKLALSKGVTVPAEPGKKHQKQLDELNKAEGKDFDHKYVNILGIDAHKEAIALFQKGQKDVQDPDLKNFITTTLPHLEQHYNMAKDLKKKVDGTL